MGLDIKFNKYKISQSGNLLYNLSLEENDIIKTCDSYRYLGLKSNQDGRHDFGIQDSKFGTICNFDDEWFVML
jgi:hypothetical protein